MLSARNLYTVIIFGWNVADRVSYQTHTHSPVSGTTQVSRYQKGKTNLDFTEARDSEWQWHQLGHMQVCTLLQTDNHASTHHSVFLQARRQSTEGTRVSYQTANYLLTSPVLRCTGVWLSGLAVYTTNSTGDWCRWLVWMISYLMLVIALNHCQHHPLIILLLLWKFDAF